MTQWDDRREAEAKSFSENIAPSTWSVFRVLLPINGATIGLSVLAQNQLEKAYDFDGSDLFGVGVGLIIGLILSAKLVSVDSKGASNISYDAGSVNERIGNHGPVE